MIYGALLVLVFKTSQTFFAHKDKPKARDTRPS